MATAMVPREIRANLRPIIVPNVMGWEAWLGSEPSADRPLIVGLGSESTTLVPSPCSRARVREVTAGFSKSHDVDAYFADDAEYDVLPLGQHYQGKEQIKGLFQVFYRDAFSPARAEIQNVIADAETRIGVLEFTFKGKHVGAQLGFPATNKEVELPMVAVYHVDGDRIRKARLYFDAAAFMRQLGM